MLFITPLLTSTITTTTTTTTIINPEPIDNIPITINNYFDRSNKEIVTCPTLSKKDKLRILHERKSKINRIILYNKLLNKLNNML
jgi:hypothetical protein